MGKVSSGWHRWDCSVKSGLFWWLILSSRVTVLEPVFFSLHYYTNWMFQFWEWQANWSLSPVPWTSNRTPPKVPHWQQCQRYSWLLDQWASCTQCTCTLCIIFLINLNLWLISNAWKFWAQVCQPLPISCSQDTEAQCYILKAREPGLNVLHSKSQAWPRMKTLQGERPTLSQHPLGH